MTDEKVTPEMIDKRWVEGVYTSEEYIVCQALADLCNTPISKEDREKMWRSMVSITHLPEHKEDSCAHVFHEQLRRMLLKKEPELPEEIALMIAKEVTPGGFTTSVAIAAYKLGLAKRDKR